MNPTLRTQARAAEWKRRRDAARRASVSEKKQTSRSYIKL